MRKSLFAFLLMAGLALNSWGQNLKDLPTETDPYKFIPKGASVCHEFVKLATTISNKFLHLYYSDLNDDGRYEKKEIVIDVNGDWIPDMYFFDFLEWYDKERRNAELARISA
jgi:hypothetical protein